MKDLTLEKKLRRIVDEGKPTPVTVIYGEEKVHASKKLAEERLKIRREREVSFQL